MVGSKILSQSILHIPLTDRVVPSGEVGGGLTPAHLIGKEWYTLVVRNQGFSPSTYLNESLTNQSMEQIYQIAFTEIYFYSYI